MSLLMNVLGNMRGNPIANLQQAMQRAQQLQRSLQNPQDIVKQFYSDVPAEYQNDPDKILKYMIDSGRITKQQIEQLQSQISQAGQMFRR